MFWFLNQTVVLQNLLSRIFTFIDCVENDTKWGIVHQKIFQEKSYGYLHDDGYRIYSSKTIHNVSFQLISCQKICKKYVLTSNRELRMQILQTLSTGVKNVSIEPLIRYEYTEALQLKHCSLWKVVEKLKVHSLRYPNFRISPQITNFWCPSSCTKLISNIAIKFYAFFIHTAHIESM